MKNINPRPLHGGPHTSFSIKLRALQSDKYVRICKLEWTVSSFRYFVIFYNIKKNVATHLEDNSFNDNTP